MDLKSIQYIKDDHSVCLVNIRVPKISANYWSFDAYLASVAYKTKWGDQKLAKTSSAAVIFKIDFIQ